MENKSEYYIHGGVQKNRDGSFTLFGTVCGDGGYLFKRQYYYYTLRDAKIKFEDAIKKEVQEHGTFTNHRR